MTKNPLASDLPPTDEKTQACIDASGNGEACRQEIEALEALHRQLETAGQRQQSELLQNAPLPGDRDTLVDAGNRCLPHVDPDDPDIPTLPGAAVRLRAIIDRLKEDGAPPAVDDDTIARFEATLNMYDRIKSRNTQDGCFFLLLGIAILIAAMLWFIIKLS